jgi:hypothetical protein
MPEHVERHAGTRHRGTYILEFGLWKATCKECGWAVTDRQRRQAAALFRRHIRQSDIIALNSCDETTSLPGCHLEEGSASTGSATMGADALG